MQEALKDFAIRKSVAVYAIQPHLKAGGHGALKKCADFVGVSPSLLSQWYSVKDELLTKKAPSPKQIKKMAAFLA